VSRDGSSRSDSRSSSEFERRKKMTLGTILLVVLVLMLIGAIPTWPHSREWGYRPSGALGVIAVIVIVLLVLGRI